MYFPLRDLLDPPACYQFLTDVLHPKGLACPNGHRLERCRVYRRHRAPVLDYRCRACGRCFNLFTGTVLRGTHYTPVQLVQLLRGITNGTPTARLAREMGVDRKWLLDRRHQLQALAERARRQRLPDQVTESDEMYQNAGEKRPQACRPRRPAPAAR
jgi:transposase-like protein